MDSRESLLKEFNRDKCSFVQGAELTLVGSATRLKGCNSKALDQNVLPKSRRRHSGVGESAMRLLKRLSSPWPWHFLDRRCSQVNWSKFVENDDRGTATNGNNRPTGINRKSIPDRIFHNRDAQRTPPPVSREPSSPIRTALAISNRYDHAMIPLDLLNQSFHCLLFVEAIPASTQRVPGYIVSDISTCTIKCDRRTRRHSFL
jgi:hypothetical protein